MLQVLTEVALSLRNRFKGYLPYDAVRTVTKGRRSRNG